MGGRDKLLEMIDGTPLLRRQAEAALSAGCETLVLLRPDDAARRAALRGLDLRIAEVKDHAEGLSASLRQAARAPRPGQPLAILLPDIPGVDVRLIRDLITTFEQAGAVKITRPVDHENRPGFPVILPHEALARFATLRGDRGLQLTSWLAMPLPDDRATRDLDTPEDWDAWRATRRP